MKTILAVMLLTMAGMAMAEPTTLKLPKKATLTFEAPPLTKVNEVNAQGRYEFLASSQGLPDPRFSLSVYVEPIDCEKGDSLKEVTACFLERSGRNPTMLADTRSTRCDAERCEVIYITQHDLGGRIIKQVHTNTLFVYKAGWVDVHISVVNPGEGDAKVLAKFAATLALKTR